MNEFITKFGEDKAKFKDYVKDLRKYNDKLEEVLITMAKLIQSDFIGKPITKVFTNKLAKVVGENISTFDLRKDDWRDVYKSININLKAEGIFYKYDCQYVLHRCVSFTGGKTCSKDMCFTEDSVKEIVEMINSNRVTIARYEDAVKHLNYYIRGYKKAVNFYVHTMENINPIFADISTAQKMSYCCNGVKHIELWQWDNAFKESVTPYILD